MTLQLSSLLASTLATGAQSQNQLTLNAINNTLTNRLNQQIANIQSQAADTTTLELLQSQLSAADTQNSAFSTASSQWLTNERFLSDVTTQLTTMNSAAASGDSTTFDGALAQAQIDIADLNVVAYVPGTQPDGVANLKFNGLGVQSSSYYNLSTPAGQSQAESAVANAQSVLSQISTVTNENQLIAASSSAGLTAEINDLNRRITEITSNQSTTVQNQISQLQQQEQEQFHVIELSLSDTANSSSVLTSNASNLATVLASQPGSRTAPTQNGFFSALETSTTDATQLTNTRLGSAPSQPDSTTTQSNSLNQAANGALLNIFG
jgi:hypothetical protein